MDQPENKSTIYVENAGQQIANPVSSEPGVDLKQIYTTVPEDKGRILDIGDAQVLAQTDETKGQEAREILEKKMEFKANEGMTEEEKFNTQITEGIASKYPDKCDFVTINDDRKLISGVVANGETRELGGEQQIKSNQLIFDKDGAYMVEEGFVSKGKSILSNEVLFHIINLYKAAEKMHTLEESGTSFRDLHHMLRKRDELFPIIEKILYTYIDLHRIRIIRLNVVKDTVAIKSSFEIIAPQTKNKSVSADDILSRL